MNNSPAEVVRAVVLAQSNSLFSMPKTSQVVQMPLYVAGLPDQPDEGGSVYDTDGVSIARLLASGTEIEKYGIQIKVRSLTYSGGYSVLSTLADQLAKVHRLTLSITGNTYKVDTIKRSSPVLSIGQDEKRRESFTLNLLMLLFV